MRSFKGDIALEISNHETIKTFKEKFIDTTGDSEIKPENIRLFCLGRELKDDFCLYSYDIVDDMTVQAMIKK